MNKDFTTDEFALMIYNAAEKEEDSKKKGIHLFADKIAKKFDECKKKAVEMLENAEKLDQFLARVDEKFKKLGTPGKKLAYIPEMIMLIRSYAIKEYEDISLVEIIAIIAALIYFVSPLDIIPDALPGIGVLDDALVIAVVIGWCDDDLDKYMEWRKNR